VLKALALNCSQITMLAPAVRQGKYEMHWAFTWKSGSTRR